MIIKSFFKIVFITNLLASSFAQAESVYPAPPHIRPLGMAQGAVGSCWAEAQVAALENAFQLRGRAVLLSTFHAHAFNRVKSNGNHKQQFLGDDPELLARFGRFVPSYMLPEDGRGYGRVESNRPSVSTYGVYDHDFPSPSSMGQTSQEFRFHGDGIDQLKNLLRSQTAVVLYLQSSYLYEFDMSTGLLEGTFKPVPMPSDSVDHAVALVGFDDDIYVGKDFPPGAFIIKNSWNENNYSYTSRYVEHDPKKISDQEGFKSFRGKINQYQNEIGYFAIPYQYVRNLAAARIGGINILGINYHAFANAYETFERKYKVETLPYYCSHDKMKGFVTLYPQLLEDVKSKDPLKKAKGLKVLTQFTSSGFMSTNSTSAIHYAKVTKHIEKGIDRSQDFYEGKFSRYYCDNIPEEFGPSLNIKQHSDYQNAIQRLSYDQDSLSGWLMALRMLYENFGGNK